MKILILEDSGSIYESFNDYAKENNMEFIKANKISAANDVFNDQKKYIDLILVDLNVLPSGLLPNEVDQTDGGKLSGWIWLKNYVLTEDISWRNKIIIYSEYVTVLKDKISRGELLGIELMEKSKHSIEDVIKTIKAKDR